MKGVKRCLDMWTTTFNNSFCFFKSLKHNWSIKTMVACIFTLLWHQLCPNWSIFGGILSLWKTFENSKIAVLKENEVNFRFYRKLKNLIVTHFDNQQIWTQNVSKDVYVEMCTTTFNDILCFFDIFWSTNWSIITMIAHIFTFLLTPTTPVLQKRKILIVPWMIDHFGRKMCQKEFKFVSY